MNSRFLFFISFFFLLIFLHCTKIGRAYFLNGLDDPLPEVTDLTVNRNSSGITLAWKNPASRGRNIYNKVLILKNTSAIQGFPRPWRDYPVFTAMGASRVAYNAAAPTFRDTEVVEDVVYFYKIFVCDTYLYYNNGVQTKVNKYIPALADYKTPGSTKTNPTDTVPPAEVSDVTFSDFTNKITWLNPTDADFSKVLILRNTSSIVDAPSAGKEYTVGVSIGASEVVHDAKSLDFDLTDIREQDGENIPYRYKKYYYKIFTYDTNRNYATGFEISATKISDKIIFVNVAASGTGDGTSWSNAYSSLNSALESKIADDATETLPVQIVVAKGIYKPRSTLSTLGRNATFQLISNVKVYGGFDVADASLSERNWRVNKTILSGDIGGDDTDSNRDGIIENADDIKGTEMVDAGGMMTVIANNSYTVVTGASDAILDGFTITAGQSNAPAGTGNYINRGGGVYNIDNHNLTLTNITFSGNAANVGGGFYAKGSDNLTLTNIVFSNNTATILGGGGLTIRGGGAILTNVAFSGNMASFGGGIQSVDANLTLTNVVFSNNTATNVGGGSQIRKNTGSAVAILTNVIMWGNTGAACTGDNFKGNVNFCTFNVQPTISHSLIQDCGVSGSSIWSSATNLSRCGTDGGNNIDADPLFDDDLRLRAGSPAIDAGSNVDPSDNTKVLFVTGALDLAGNPRIVGSSIDMGAYESQ